MVNPNNNMNAYNQALIINRDLKKRIDKANAIIDELIKSDEIVHTKVFLNEIKEILNGRH